MKQFWPLRFCATAVACVLPPISFAADNCTTIEAGKTGSAILNRPGHYCLTRSMTIEGKYNSWVWEGSKYLSDDHIALVIAADDVDVDLRGNSIYSHAREVMAGVQSALVNTGEPTVLGKSVSGYRKRSWDAAYRRISIRNGVLDLERGDYGLMFPGSGTYYGSFVGGDVPIYFSPAHARSKGCDGLLMDILPPTARDYPVRNITLERLTIRSPSCGVIVQGAKTVIRDSVIETDSYVGLLIFGPDAIIENNTIILRDGDKDYPVRPHDAPIRLQQADGAIVRNNRIVMRSGIFSRTKGAAAIDLLDSMNVLIEGNTVEKFDDLLRKDVRSTAIERGNRLK